MKIIDMHCDTISKIFHSDGNKNLSENDLSVDIGKLKNGNSFVQFFALYIYKKLKTKKFGYNSLYEYTMAMLDCFYNEIEKNSNDISAAGNYQEIIRNGNDDKISAVLTIEEGGVIEEDISKLRNFYRLGVRLITLTWNFPNSLGYPNCYKKYMKRGLTDFGKNIVEEMNYLGMIVDVSHLSDGGFYDVVDISSKPFVASHSNVRTIKDHTRNLTDDMIRKLSEKGGIMGINFSASFIGDGKVSKIDDIIRHIKHVKNVGGIDVIALGSDFDGISCELEINDFGEMGKLIEELKKNGFNEEEIEKICYKNAKRVIKDVL